jgi:hypothetical protein
VVFKAPGVGDHFLVDGVPFDGHLAASGHGQVAHAAFELDIPESVGTQ